MKKSIFLAVAAVAMTACSNDVDLGMKDANKQTADNAIGFEVRNSNMSRGTQGLEATGHYNFGVWAYKDLDPTHAIMANYLVGYFGDNVGYKRSDKQTTYGTEASLVDLKSRWAYEGLGTSEYDHASNSVGEKYYRNTDTDKFYMSNWSVQYLRYWDYSSQWTKFFAYAPYINADKQLKYVWVTRFSHEKGHDLLIKALHLVRKKNSNAHLYLVGKFDQAGAFFQELTRLIDSLDLKDYVHLVGFDSNPYRWVKNGDVYVMPSRLEGLPNSLIDAMYLGKPVVATCCIPVIDRIVEDGYNGYVVPSEDVEAMAEAMLKAPGLKGFKMTYKPASKDDVVDLFRNV